MSTLNEQIEAIQKEIRETPYHKGTEHHIGRLRARLAKLKEKQLDAGRSRSGGGSSSKGYDVKKQGDATVVLVGPPSVGKSTLLNCLTNAKSKVAPYAFTTVSVIPGMMEYRDARIQILDVPGLIQGAGSGRGRGKEVLSVVRGSDLVVLLTDIENTHAFKQLENELYQVGIRLNTKPPQVRINKLLKGGINVRSNIRQDYDLETVKEIAKEFRITNAEIVLGEKISMESLIDAFSRNRVYVPAIYVVNKAERIKEDQKDPEYVYISARENLGIENLKKLIWEKLSLIRVYLVKYGNEPSRSNPIIIQSGSSLEDLSKQLGSRIGEYVKRALIWGSGAKYPAQEVSLSTIAQDGMYVRFKGSSLV